jgi:hypothetical protein
MRWWVATGIRGAMTKIAVAVALIAIASAGVAVPANAAPGVVGGIGVPLDDLPTGPLDPKCATMPADAACVGSPFVPPPPPPPQAMAGPPMPPPMTPPPIEPPHIDTPPPDMGGGMPGHI